ncbi:hypothetical protein CK203_045696 [Vitis vinifera]|uniref:Uncharacterized protein n=1 Tax=Vitis vinifera TaxID=29760 RepID=A0A438I0U7_VITVI|nr:hypothetical protein CK203_045696 [Vitis vinifera]
MHKVGVEMLGGFGKVESKIKVRNEAPTVDDPVNPDETEDFDVIFACMETMGRQITDAQSHVNSLIASYNRDMNVLRTHFTYSYYRIDEGNHLVRMNM